MEYARRGRFEWKDEVFYDGVESGNIAAFRHEWCYTLFLLMTVLSRIVDMNTKPEPGKVTKAKTKRVKFNISQIETQ